MQNNKYLQYLDKVCEYWWNYAQTNHEFLKLEKQFMDDCLNLIDLSLFPNVPVEYINEVRKMILSAIETSEYDRESLKQQKNELHSMISSSPIKKTAIQIHTWDAIEALFPSSYTASGDPLIECFAESMVIDFNVSEEIIASLLCKYFKHIIELDNNEQ